MNIRRTQPGFSRHAAQKGAVLLIALIFLILLTLIAIGASSGSLLQQRMVAATRSAQLAVMSGNTALRGAEWRIWSASAIVSGSFICDAGDINTGTGCVKYDPSSSSLYGTSGTVTEFQDANNAWLSLTGPVTYTGANSSGYTDTDISGNTTADIAENPQYIVEDLGLVRPPGSGPQHESGDTGPNNGGAGQINVHVFRITARAAGGNTNTVRVVQSTFDAQATN
jgi:type IV pilus assembly protein PilX